LANLTVGVQVRNLAKSLRRSEPTHLNLWFKVTGAAATLPEGTLSPVVRDTPAHGHP